MRVPWTARSNQSILEEINPEYSLEGLMLKPRYFDHLMQRSDSLEKTLMFGKTESRKEKRATEDEMVGWRHRFNGHEFGQSLGDGEGQGVLECCRPWGHEESDSSWRLNNSGSSTFRFDFVCSLAALGLCCCIWALSSCGETELLSDWDVQAPCAYSFSCFGAQAAEAQAQCTGLVALWWVEASQTTDLNHWTTREVPACFYMFKILYNKKCKKM